MTAQDPNGGRPAAHTHYRRFGREERLLHGFLMFSFVGLAFTGLPLLFSHQPWAATIARFLGGVARQLFIEFVPRTDPMAKALLETRPGMFTDYSQQAFEDSFAREFRLERRAALAGSERVLYWMRRS